MQYRISHFVSVSLAFNLHENDLEWEVAPKFENYYAVIFFFTKASLQNYILHQSLAPKTGQGKNIFTFLYSF